MSVLEGARDHEGGPDRDGRALVLLHGAGGSYLAWAEVRARLAAGGVPAVALDLPGHGRSPLPLTADVGAHAGGVAARLRELGVRRAVVVGHSLGGAVALRLAVSRAIPVDGLGVVSSGGRLPVSASLLSGLLGDFPATVARIARSAFAKPADPARRAEFEAMLLEAGPERMHADFQACAGYGLSPDELAGVAVPVSIVYGDQDVLTPAALAEELAAALSIPALIRLPGVGHLPLIEAPGETSAALEELWGRVHGPRTCGSGNDLDLRRGSSGSSGTLPRARNEDPNPGSAATAVADRHPEGDGAPAPLALIGPVRDEA